MRLDKYLSKALQITRTEASKLISDGKVKVNNKIIYKKDFHIDENNDEIDFNGELLTYQEFNYLMINKPQGVVSAVIDNKYPTIIDLVEDKRLFPVGRLDIDTEGLIILTNDGTLAHRLTSPHNNILKGYFVRVKDELKEEDVKRFKEGLEILDGKDNLFTTKPAELRIINFNECLVYITEGKFHQVKRMFEKIGNKVIYLKRVYFAGIELDEDLPLGGYRQLTKDEINHLKKICNL